MADGRSAAREATALARLALPIIGGQLALMGLSFIDTVMAGRLGAAPLAAVAVGASVWSAVNLFLLGTLLAVPALVAELDGAGRRRRVAPLLSQALWVALGLALAAVLGVANLRPLLTLLHVQPEIVPVTAGYLRALCWGIPCWALYLAVRFTAEGLGETRPVLVLGVLGLPLNAAANYLLMYGGLGLPRLGAVGCGYATAVVWAAQAVGMVIWVLRQRKLRDLRLLLHLQGPRAAPIRKILRLGLPIAASLFIEGSIFTAVALVLSTMGTDVVAGHQVALNFAAITYMLPLGVAMAITVRVGGALGRRDAAALRFSAGVGVAMAMACQVVSASVMLLAPRAVANLYTHDPRVVAVAVHLLFFAALFQLSDGLQVSVAAALRGVQDTRMPMLIVVVAYWLVGLPLGALLSLRLGWGASGMWVGLIAGLSVAALLLTLRFLRVAARLDRRFAPPARAPGA